MTITSWIKVCLVALTVFCSFALDSCSQNQDDPEPDSKITVSEGKPAPGEGVVALSRTEQEKGGIVTAPIGTVLHQLEIKAYGSVMDLRDFLAIRNTFEAARADAEKADADLTASKKAYERQRTLYRSRQDVSAKALQEAEAAWKSNEADARAARSALESVKVQAQQQWGDRLAEWLIRDSEEFEQLKRREKVLIQITIPPDVRTVKPPSTMLVEAGAGKFAQAAYVSTSPRSDPRIQGQSFFYTAAAKEAGLLPGMNVLAFLPAGQAIPGVVIPSSAVVWRNGKAWVYVEQGPGRFIRREVSAEVPAKGGWFITKGFHGGESLVVTGAELLLSKEFLPAKPKEEDED